jgi:hypothetical protein
MLYRGAIVRDNYVTSMETIKCKLTFRKESHEDSYKHKDIYTDDKDVRDISELFICRFSKC